MSVHSELTVVVVGTGIMAGGIAAGFLANGAEVVILGRSLASAEQARATAQALAADLVPSGPASRANGVRVGTIDGWSEWSGIGWSSKPSPKSWT